MSVTGRILRLRAEHDLYQREVAEGIGISVAAYQKMEASPYDPRLERAVKLADFYGISLDELVGRSPPDSENDNRAMEDSSG